MPTLSETSSSSNSSSSDEGEIDPGQCKNDFVSRTENNYSLANPDTSEFQSNINVDDPQQELPVQCQDDAR